MAVAIATDYRFIADSCETSLILAAWLLAETRQKHITNKKGLDRNPRDTCVVQTVSPMRKQTRREQDRIGGEQTMNTQGAKYKTQFKTLSAAARGAAYVSCLVGALASGALGTLSGEIADVLDQATIISPPLRFPQTSAPAAVSQARKMPTLQNLVASAYGATLQRTGAQAPEAGTTVALVECN